jgi:hypothetical protein
MSRSDRQPPEDEPAIVSAIDFVRWEYSSATIGAGVATLRLHRPDGSILDLLLRAEQEREIALRLAEAHAGDLIALFRSRGWIPDDHS